tara:strand:+ start:114 stop:2867 length:2754 start_codon:yes stop_codon:yes gene_type:complete
MAVNYQQMMTGGSQAKKKKQPFNPYAGGSSTPDQQDPLTSALVDSNAPANMPPGTGANNMAANMPPGAGGNVNAPVNNMAANQPPGAGGNVATPPPPPPPPPSGNLAPNTPANMAPGTGATTTPPPMGGTGYTEDTASSAFGGATTQQPDYKNEIMDAIRKNPAAFRGAGIRHFRTADGKGIMDVPPEVRAEIDQFLGGTEFQQMASVGTTPTAPVATPPPTQQQAQAPVTTAPPTQQQAQAPTMQQAQAPTQPTMSQAQAPTQPTMQQAQGLAGEYRNPYADAAAQQPDTGLRTFSGRPEFSPMQQQLQQQQRPEFSDPLQEALQAQYMSRIGGTDDPILASQLADQQMRQEEAQRDLIERLGRFGVLRGGGDTAAALARMSEGDERNRLALEAQAAQRLQQDLLNAQGFGESRSRQDIARGDFGLRESQAEQDMLTQALNRDIQRAGMTGEFEGGRTLAAQEQAQRMRLAEEAEQRARAGLTGEFEGGQTLQAERQQAELGALAGGERRADMGLESELFGEVGGRATLGGRRAEEDLLTSQQGRDLRERADQRADLQENRAERALRSDLLNQGQRRRLNELEETRRNTGFLSEMENQELNRLIAEAEQTGQFRGDTTLRGQQVGSALDSEALRRELLQTQEDRAQTGFESQEDRLASEEGRRARGFETQEDRLAAAEGRAATGFETQEDRLAAAEDRAATGFGTQEERLASAEQRAQEGFEDDLLTRALSRDVTEAGQTGEFRDEGMTEQAKLARADRLGLLDGDATIAGRDADMRLIGAIQAAQDAGADPDLLAGLTRDVKRFDEESVEDIQKGLNPVTSEVRDAYGSGFKEVSEQGRVNTGNSDVDREINSLIASQGFGEGTQVGVRTADDNTIVVELHPTGNVRGQRAIKARLLPTGKLQVFKGKTKLNPPN